MPRYEMHSYRADADLQRLIDFARRTTAARLPGPPYYHLGDFVWQLYALDASDDVALWSDDRRVVGCAIFEPPLNVQFEVDPSAEAEASLLAEMMVWAEARRALVADADDVPVAYAMLGSDTLSTSVFDTDVRRASWLAERGYVRVERGGVRFVRDLSRAAPEGLLPPGARVRHSLDSDLAERVDLHRDAWSVWGESSFTIEAYRRLRAAPGYDADLDIVVESGGRLVSYCIGWSDAVSGVGYFEPVGTRPSATGRGYGRAAMREGMHRMRERGLRTATVGTASVNSAAQALYASAGFQVIETEHFYTKSFE